MAFFSSLLKWFTQKNTQYFRMILPNLEFETKTSLSQAEFRLSSQKFVLEAIDLTKKLC